MTMENERPYDVVIIGGALSGAATATLLLRQNPGIRVLIVEKSAKLTRRVGEATVEVSAYFMGRILGLTQYLNEHHLVKQGLRFWFASDEVKNLEEASELGGRYQVRLPSYQLDRATFDEEVLRSVALHQDRLGQTTFEERVDPAQLGAWPTPAGLHRLLCRAALRELAGPRQATPGHGHRGNRAGDRDALAKSQDVY
jgi:choline dehydrogenase-like flavoprotein